VRLVLVDDHPVLRDAIRGVLASRDPPMEVVGEASTARQAVTMVESLRPDIVIMDVLLPGQSGLAATRDVRRATPTCRILVYTALVVPGFALEALAAGADGYAVKTDGADELLLAINQVARGKPYVAPSIKQALDGAAGKQSLDGGNGTSSRGGLSTLSGREREIFDLVVRGYTNHQLATELFISVKTVETHRSRINKKLGVHSTAQLIRFAALSGLVSS
jgi:DNA-binding NarL/FixJ family response regulator